VRFASWSGDRSSRVAYVLVAAFVVTYLAMERHGWQQAIDRFALSRAKVGAGEWWRLLTCVFLHGNWMHLLFNCAAALSLAGIARALVSEAHILGVFAASAVAGSVASALMAGKPSVGASGAILGWGGLLLGMALAHRELRPTGLISNLMRWIVLLVLIGVAGMGFIDNAAHAGGLVMGLAMGLWIARDGGRPLPVEWKVPRAALVVMLAPWLWMLWRLLG
jgi:membrane associated rhomboid family serine protease